MVAVTPVPDAVAFETTCTTEIAMIGDQLYQVGRRPVLDRSTIINQLKDSLTVEFDASNPVEGPSVIGVVKDVLKVVVSDRATERVYLGPFLRGDNRINNRRINRSRSRDRIGDRRNRIAHSSHSNVAV
jgi:hypothetical protein